MPESSNDPILSDNQKKLLFHMANGDSIEQAAKKIRITKAQAKDILMQSTTNAYQRLENATGQPVRDRTQAVLAALRADQFKLEDILIKFKLRKRKPK